MRKRESNNRKGERPYSGEQSERKRGGSRTTLQRENTREFKKKKIGKKTADKMMEKEDYSFLLQIEIKTGKEGKRNNT